MEALLKKFMAKNDAIIKSQTVSLRALENQVGQFATAFNSKQQGKLSSDTKSSRSQGGTQLPGVVNDTITKEGISTFTNEKNSELVGE
ncbi:hypothetical protein EPI10_021150 [Gossypium australe]|uniref:Uncharacterized protein n=1 Tax=Gossypium australe TaxID=47621 RepID=A0A5B6WHF8_9ROSI|nr:hypothetical protein EPI10_021150 [Gossypium australe]